MYTIYYNYNVNVYLNVLCKTMNYKPHNPPGFLCCRVFTLYGGRVRLSGEKDCEVYVYIYQVWSISAGGSLKYLWSGKGSFN